MGIIISTIAKLEDKHSNLKNRWLWKKFKVFHQCLLSLKYPYHFSEIPSEQKKHALLYFQNNQQRINAVVEKLSDNKSKKVYLSSIKFRQTGRWIDIVRYINRGHQYYLDKLIFSDTEVYLDCGVGNVDKPLHDTISRFISYCPNFQQIIAFEPNLTDFYHISEKYKTYSNIRLYNTGLFNFNGEISFIEKQLTSTSSIVVSDDVLNANEDGNAGYKISVLTIDSLNFEKVTFIKMDIEGAEYEALQGAKHTIQRDKPKLAICIYHSNEDMIRIAEYISSLVPEYKLYIRQYHIMSETVLYCVM